MCRYWNSTALFIFLVVSIEPTTGNRFRGFMIQGQTQPGGSPVGTFAASGTNYQAVCDNNVRT